MAALREKGKVGWWTLAGKPIEEREIIESTDEDGEEVEEGRTLGTQESNAIPNRLTLGRAHFCCNGDIIEIQGNFPVLNQAFEYRFHGLYKNNTSTQGYSVFDTDKLDYRPKSFCAPVFHQLLEQHYKSEEIAQLRVWLQTGETSTTWNLHTFKQKLLSRELRKSCDNKELRTLIKTVARDRDVVRYFWFSELQLLEQYYNKSIREYLLHNATIQNILQLYSIFHTGHKLHYLCFHVTKATLEFEGLNLRRLPELKYESFMKAQAAPTIEKPATPKIVNAVSIYHEILFVSTYGHKQSDFFDRSKQLLYKPSNHGHLYTDYGTVYKYCRDQPNCESSLTWLRKRDITVEAPMSLEDLKHISTKRHIYLSSIWNTQQRLIGQIKEISKRWEREGGEKGMTLRTGNYKFRNDSKLNKLQQAAVQAAMDHPISIITGRGGTGKTEAVKHVIDRYGNDNLEENTVLFVGPTGMSADNAKRRVISEAFTMDKVAHTLCKALPMQKSGKLKLEDDIKNEDADADAEKMAAASSWNWYLRMTPQQHRMLLGMRRLKEFATFVRRWRRVEVLVIDEMSMVDMEKLEFLLRMLVLFSHLKKVVFLGDVQQLQSIGAGCVMADLIKAFPQAVTRLRTNMRNPSSTIFHNAEICMRPKSRGPKELHYDDSFQLLPYDAKSNESNVYLEVDKLFAKLAKEGQFEPKDVHFVAFRRCDVRIFNQACRRHHTPHYTPRTDGKADRPEFLVGDLIYFKKNNYTYDVMNGQIWKIIRFVDIFESGRVREDEVSSMAPMKPGTVTRVAVLSREDGQTINSIDLHDLPLNFKNVSLGFATTIHKFQGKEKPVVGCYTQNHFLEDASHFYTATTRSTHAVYIIGTKRAVDDTISRPVPTRRSQFSTLLQQRMEHDTDDDGDTTEEEEEQKEPCVKRQKIES